MPKVPFEYFDPKAPWNKAAPSKSAQEREKIIRRHLDDLLPRFGDPEPGSEPHYRSPQRHELRTLLMEIIPCRAPASDPQKYAVDHTPEEIIMAHANLYPHISEKISEGYLTDVSHMDRETIIRILARRSMPLYALTQSQRIKAWGRHIKQARKSKGQER